MSAFAVDTERHGKLHSSVARRAAAVAMWIAVAGLLGAGAVLAQDSKAVDDLMRQAQAAMSQRQAGGGDSIAAQGDRHRARSRLSLYMLRSRAHESSGKFDAALDDATKYIELEPNDAYGYLNRARIYMSLDRLDSALEDANKAIELAPEEPDAYYRRADIYLEMGKDAEAKADEAKAEELDKKARR